MIKRILFYILLLAAFFYALDVLAPHVHAQTFQTIALTPPGTTAVPPLAQTIGFAAAQYSDKQGPKWSMNLGGADLLSQKAGVYGYVDLNYNPFTHGKGTSTSTSIGGLIFLRAIGPVKIFALATGGVTATSTATLGNLTGAGLAEWSKPGSAWGLFFAYQYSSATGKDGYFGYDYHFHFK